MNYDFRKHSRRFFAEGSIDASDFDARVTNMLMRYRKNMLFGQLNLLDSHDVSRFLSLCGGDRKRYKLAVLFMMSFVGMPTIFYGDEQGIDGVLESEYRKAMSWSTGDDMYSFFKALIQVRKSTDALKHGDFETVYADEGQNLYLFKRVYNDEVILVALNMNVEPVLLPVHGKIDPLFTIGAFDSKTHEIAAYGGVIGRFTQ
jgi:glycosidase